MKRRILLVMLFMIIGVLISSVSSVAQADTLMSDEFAVTSTLDLWEIWPRLGNDGLSDLVVFTRREMLTNGSMGQGDVWFQRLAAGAPLGDPIQITDALTDDQLNDVSGDFVVYTAYDSVISDSGRIMLYQISTGVLFAIGNALVIQEPRIAGTKVVWRQGPNTGKVKVGTATILFPEQKFKSGKK